MPKKNMSPEERKAFGEKMKAARLKKQQLEEQADRISHPDAVPTTISQDEYQALLKQIAELKSALPQSSPQVNQRGSLVGTFEKYVIDPNNYDDPRERLAKEPRLQRFAFPLNYELEWDVSSTSYETIDGVRTREPKFTLGLNRIISDEDTGEPTNKRYTICRMILHEDPEAALVVARDNGLDVSTYGEREFLNEMRYLRMRDWLIEAFYPPKPSQDKMNKRETVIGNKLVEVFEINSESSETVPFNQLSKKL